MGVIHFIENLRRADYYIKHIFMNGSCYKFHLFLKKLYPVAVPYINKDKDHVITKIDGLFYDILGLVSDFETYEPLKKSELKLVAGWNFGKNNLLKLTECPACDEPICATFQHFDEND